MMTKTTLTVTLLTSALALLTSNTWAATVNASSEPVAPVASSTVATNVPTHATVPTDGSLWPRWVEFRTAAVEGGRVIDRSDARLITTSEGQSYGMFFALIANDRETFKAIWDWTKTNLCAGDCAKTRVAWLWGASAPVVGNNANDGKAVTWGVIDSNNATDADLWMAYSLLDAEKRWGVASYRKDALALLERLKADTRVVRGLGRVLLPANVGFEKNGDVVLNPSYYPISLLKGLERVDPFWHEVRLASLRVLYRSAESGFSPDWVAFGQRWGTRNRDEGSVGSWNAIRVYLWAGLMNPEDPDAARLKATLRPMLDVTRAAYYTPEDTDTAANTVSTSGPLAFSACLLPWLKNDKAGAYIRSGLAQMALTGEDYYRSVLALFAMGFDEGRYAFGEDGSLWLRDQP